VPPPPFRIRLGGYAPPESVHTQAARFFKAAVEAEAGGAVAVDVFHNVLDFGYAFGDLVEMVRSGLLTCAYASTAYLAEAVPSLGAFDLPFLFAGRPAAHAAMDGAIGDLLAREAEAHLGLTWLGYWENGFRHVTSRQGPVTSLADLAGLRIRIQPNAIHERTFALLGAVPVPTDIKDLLPAILEGRVLDLTYMEYELLKLLASSPGRVFTREEILARVWGYDYFGGMRTVDVHVRRLRAKFGQDHAWLIETVRSVGYRFAQIRA